MLTPAKIGKESVKPGGLVVTVVRRILGCFIRLGSDLTVVLPSDMVVSWVEVPTAVRELSAHLQKISGERMTRKT